MSTNRTFRTSDSEALSEVRQHHSIGRTSGNAANVAPRRRPKVENYRTSCNRLKHACWISGQAFMSSYYPSSAHHSSAACPSTRRSSTSRQDSSAAPVRYKSNTSPPQVLWSRTTRLQWTRDTSATSEYSRQVAQHISRTEGLRSVTEYRRTVAGRPVAPTPRATADIRDPAVS